MPHVTDVEAMNELNRHSLVGIYWLVNHHDNAGSLSRGQLYDLEIALHKLRSYLPDPFFEELRKFVATCVDQSTIVHFGSEMPPPQPPSPQLQPQRRSREPPVSSPSPSPFAYTYESAAEPPAPAIGGMPVGDVLNQLAPLVAHAQGAYHPGQPAMGM